MNSFYLHGQWLHGQSESMFSYNPADGSKLYEGQTASHSDVQLAVSRARSAFSTWRSLELEQRIDICRNFTRIVEVNRQDLAELISKETGKPLWDALSEVSAVIGKLDISIEAYSQRTPTKELLLNGVSSKLSHKAFGVMAVFGPYNFPFHLPNGHIIPALLAGNTIVFKPSDLTPACGEKMVELWKLAGIPEGVVNVVQGDKATGIALASADIDGLLFTGSVNTGRALHKQFAGYPEKMLALELGGNNPMIVESVEEADKAALIVTQSAFISSGQRCTCLRRLLVPKGKWGDEFLEKLTHLIGKISIGAFTDKPEPFMGPLVSESAAKGVLKQQQTLISIGARPIVYCQALELGGAFISPGLIDTTDIDWDEEIFGPLLQVKRYSSFDHAIEIANDTKFGLAAGLISDNLTNFELFSAQINAGVVNLNRPLTGANSAMPFGGLGASGNNRPSAYYAADYCAHPIATQYQLELTDSPLISQRLKTTHKEKGAENVR